MVQSLINGSYFVTRETRDDRQKSYIAAAADDNEPEREFFLDVDSRRNMNERVNSNAEMAKVSLQL